MTTPLFRVLLFSGQGAQRVGMGGDLMENSARARSLYEQADAHLGWPLSQICRQGLEAELTETRVCQPALYVHGLALLAALEEHRGQPLPFSAAAGLSLGEYTAHAAAGSFSFTTGLSLVARRGLLMQQACDQTQGTMMTLLGATEEQARVIAQTLDVDIANINCPGQIVLAGLTEVLAALPEVAKAHGVRRALPLNVAGAYHSRLMASAALNLEPALAEAEIVAPRVPVIANFDAEFSATPDKIRADLQAQVCGSVRWEASIRHLLQLGATEFIELGPGRIIAGMLKRIDPAARCLSLESYADIVEHADVLH